jgi:hypothetical protein
MRLRINVTVWIYLSAGVSAGRIPVGPKSKAARLSRRRSYTALSHFRAGHRDWAPQNGREIDWWLLSRVRPCGDGASSKDQTVTAKRTVPANKRNPRVRDALQLTCGSRSDFPFLSRLVTCREIKANALFCAAWRTEEGRTHTVPGVLPLTVCHRVRAMPETGSHEFTAPRACRGS